MRVSVSFSLCLLLIVSAVSTHDQRVSTADYEGVLPVSQRNQGNMLWERDLNTVPPSRKSILIKEGKANVGNGIVSKASIAMLQKRERRKYRLKRRNSNQEGSKQIDGQNIQRRGMKGLFEKIDKLIHDSQKESSGISTYVLNIPSDMLKKMGLSGV